MRPHRPAPPLPAEWSEYESRADFVAWADDPALDRNGEIRYAIVDRTPCSGLGWRRLLRQQIRGDRAKIVKLGESKGAFYDGAYDHPEGAIEWARSSARRHAAYVTGLLAEFDARVEARLDALAETE